MMIIYKITNLTNNKMYIGKTKYGIVKRFKEHTKSSSELGNDIKKLGIDKFKIEQIDCASNQFEYDNKERYWIIYYNAINVGYNKAIPKLIPDNRVYEYGLKKPIHRYKQKSINFKSYILSFLDTCKSLTLLDRLPTEFEVEYWANKHITIQNH